MKKIKFLSVLGLIAVVFSLAPRVLAYGPTLSASNNGGNVVLSVSNAYPNSQVSLSYTVSGSTLATTVSNFGYTDGGGNFSTTVSSSSYGIANASQVYVTVGGQQSNIVSLNGYYTGGCNYYGCGSVGGLTLNPSSVNLSFGQSTYVTISSGVYMYAYAPYVSGNTNSAVASASISGTSLYITANASGSTTITVCLSGGSTCGSVYVTVSGGYGNNQITFSQSNVSLSTGQTQSVSIYNNGYGYSYNNGYYISGNTNSSAVSASISGSSLSLYGNSSGSSTVTVCTNGSGYGNNCGSVYVTVSGGTCYAGYCGTLSLSQSSVNVSAGQTAYVTASGYSGNLYLSGNTNSSVVSVNLSGSQVTLYGLVSGSSTVTVCASNNGQCGTIYVTVNGGSGGSLSLSQTNVSLNLGQSTTVTAYNSYGSSVYVSNNTNSSVVTTSVSGNVVYLTSASAGSATITICASSYTNNCGTVYVTVTGGSSGTLSFSPSSPTLSVGQTLSVSVYNNSSYYSLYIASNSNQNAVTASVSGNTISLYGVNNGSSTIYVCTNGSSQCGYLYVTVSGYGSGSNIILSPSVLNLSAGQTSTVTVTGPYSYYNYYISGNSSPTVASAVLQGNVLTVTGVNSGFTTMTICQNSASQCSVLSVNVNNGGNYGGGNLNLSQSSVSLAVNQSAYVTANNYNSLYVSSNSNPGVVSVSVSGNQITLRGIATGSSTVSICAYSYSQCGYLYVTVTGGGVLGASTYTNGTLISENGTVYIVYRNTKTGFASASVFLGLGFNFNNVINVGYSGLSDSGYIVRTQYAAHPWGSWVKSGHTVYFVSELGLVPVPDYSTFTNNGGRDNLVVPANSWDFQMPQLSPMIYNDGRLQ